MRILLTAVALLSIAACKKKPQEPAAAPEPEPKVELSVEMPREAAAMKLAERLVADGLTGVNPTGSSEFSMNFTFHPTGNWSGKGHAELGGESLDCEEAGTWKIDTMEGDKGIVQWAIVRTNCPNRNGGDVQRALVGFEGKEHTISFR